MKIPKALIKFTGNTMLSKYPPWVIYKPDIHRVRGADVRRVLDIVEAGDILLRRFDGYLSTILTPGYWGHAGLYVGRNQVVHAISQGTIQEDILNFLRTDAVCVLTLKDITADEITEAILKAKAAANKNIEYDFDFSECNEKYYCTELINAVFNHSFIYDYQEVWGQMILTPDGIRYSEEVRVKLEIKP